ncbi:FecR family protein [Chitinophaga eiseniae]|nr:FecR family protein [Chitinophaga eiseniae]
MDNDHLLILIEKYLNGEATATERKWLENWYASFDNSADWLREGAAEAMEITAELKQSLQGKLAGAAQLKAVNKQVFSLRRNRRLLWAAAIVLLLGSSVLLYRLLMPAGIMETVVAGAGPRTVALPDGSVALLQAGSSIRYDKKFNGDRREVLLEGGAQFNVTAHAHPFVVSSGQLSTCVLGTVFTIQAYPDTDSISITVLEGKVQVSKQQQVIGTLGSEDRLVYNIPTGAVARYHIQNSEVQCNNQTLQEIMALLGQWYGYTIQASDTTILQERYTGSLNRHETLEELLAILCEVNHINYEVDKKSRQIMLTRK